MNAIRTLILLGFKLESRCYWTESQAGSSGSARAVGFARWTGRDPVLPAKRIQADLMRIISIGLVPLEVGRTQLAWYC